VQPLSALATPPLMAELRGRFSGAKITGIARSTSIVCGDEGGVMCQLTFDEEEKEEWSSCH